MTLSNPQNKLTSIKRNDTLKIIAMITMLIDHIGFLLFPQYTILRIIGRISFPLFAYGIAFGYSKTSNFNKYLIRLLIFGLISQIVYMRFSPYGDLNIMFTLAAGLICIKVYDSRLKFLSFVIPFFFLIPQVESILDLSYGTYGVLMVLLFYISLKSKPLMTITYIVNSIIYIYIYMFPPGIDNFSITELISIFIYNPSIQFYSILSLPLIWINPDFKISLNKYMGYLFYPLHIGILLLLHYFLF